MRNKKIEMDGSQRQQLMVPAVAAQHMIPVRPAPQVVQPLLGRLSLLSLQTPSPSTTAWLDVLMRYRGNRMEFIIRHSSNLAIIPSSRSRTRSLGVNVP